MKKIFLPLLILIALFFGVVYYINYFKKEIPLNIVKSNETILNVDKIRFTFKISALTKSAMNALLLGLSKNDSEQLEIAIESCEAAIGFAEITYTKDDKLLNYVVPRLEKSISLMETQGLNLNSQQFETIKKNFDEVNYFTENREKEIWANIQQNYISFRTDEVEKMNLYKILAVISVLLLIVSIVFIVFRTKVEEKQKTLIQKLDYAADEALNGYWEWHLDSNYLYLSKGWKKFLGYEENELENSFETFETCLHPDDIEVTMNLANSYLKKKQGLYKAKFRLRHKDGTYKWVSSIGSLLENNKNIFFGFHIDIDDLTTTKETLIAQSKSAIMGEMIGAIAHQIKQPLSVISMQASNQLANIELEEDITTEMIKNDANENLKQVLHLSETIDTFKNFLKPTTEKTATSIETILESSLNLLDKSFKNNDIEIIKNFSPTKEIKVYSSELMQVFLNIFGNSKDAFKINNISERIIYIKTLQKEQEIIIEVEDTAGGIPEDKLENIFDAYFTTKENDGGTGLGLFIVNTILEEHYNSSITAKNTEKGVKFTITLKTL